jgi:hypothetical protein
MAEMGMKIIRLKKQLYWTVQLPVFAGVNNANPGALRCAAARPHAELRRPM